MTNRAIAPTDFSLPRTVADALFGAPSVVDHGFGDSIIGTSWWNDRLSQKGYAARVELNEHGGSARLTRSDLFERGAKANSADASLDTLLGFVCSVFAWGAGASQRGNSKRLESFTTSKDAQQNAELIRRAMASASEGDARAAYRTLVRPGDGRIGGLGPAFFTKILYFASEGAPRTRCLILDARVAANLARHGWTSLPSVRGTYSYNWYTDTYVSYCELLERWAQDAEKAIGRPVRPDEIERALFLGA